MTAREVRVARQRVAMSPFTRDILAEHVATIGRAVFRVELQQWNVDLVIEDLVEQVGRADAFAGTFPIAHAVLAVEGHLRTFPRGDSGGMVTV